MAVTPRNTLKTYFQTGDLPTQEQFWAWLDSFWHKNDSLPGGGGGGFTWSEVPTTSSDPGEEGQMAYDELYLYVCVATDTWRRMPLNDW